MKKLLVLFFSLFLFIGVNAETITVTSIDDIVQLYNDSPDTEVEMIIDGEVILSKPLTVKKDKSLKLTGSGTGVIKLADGFNPNNSSNYIPFVINEGASLIIDNVILDGNSEKLTLTSRRFMTVKGNLTLNNGGIRNITMNPSIEKHMDDGFIQFSNNSKFIMNGGTIENNKILKGYSHGLLYFKNTSIFEMNGGKIINNSFKDDDVYDPFTFHSGIVYLDPSSNGSSKFTMNGGEISGNDISGVYLGTDGSTNLGVVEFTMNGGSITNNDLTKNKSGNSDAGIRRGGGIYLFRNGIVNINGGTISNNKADYGGGIANSQRAISTTSKLTINGGTISNNEAEYGGGIFINNNNVIDHQEESKVLITGGNITNNNASIQGGGIYVVKDSAVYLENVVIKDNYSSILGGGIWSCPTATVEVFVTNGGAVYNNKAGSGTEAAGNDIVSDPKQSDHETTLSERMLGGGKNEYYKDGGVQRGPNDTLGNAAGIPTGELRYANDKKDLITDISNTLEGFALHNDVLPNAIKLAEKEAKLVIANNTSARGGGIGSNGNVYIGTDDTYTLNVKKEWIDVKEKYEVEVVLIKDGLELDSIYLNKKNNYNGEFSSLPAGTYSIKEINNNLNIVVSYDKENIKLDSSLTEETITVTNTFVGGEGGDEEEPVKEEPKPEFTSVKTGAENTLLQSSLLLNIFVVAFIYIMRKEARI